MRPFARVAELLALAAGFLSLSPVALAYNFTRRNVDANQLASSFRSAVLLISTTATSCELGVIDSSAVFVAASCLAFKSNGDVDNSIDYIVAINGVGGSGNGRYSVQSIDVHPQYYSGSFANNIAILQINMGSSIKWRASMGLDRNDWDDIYYTSRTLSNTKTPSFNSPSIVDISSSDGGCAAASNLYKDNTDWMLCVTQTTTSSVNGKCQLPYGAAWGAYQPSDIALGAIYSHSVLYGTGLCGNQPKQYHYYTMLQPYTAWAAKLLGRSVQTFAADSSYKYSGSSSFAMNSKYAPNVFGTTFVSGDFFPSQKSYNGPGPDPIAPPPVNTPGGGGNVNPPDPVVPVPSPTQAPPATTANNNNNNGNNGGGASPTSTADPGNNNGGSNSSTSIDAGKNAGNSIATGDSSTSKGPGSSYSSKTSNGIKSRSGSSDSSDSAEEELQSGFSSVSGGNSGSGGSGGNGSLGGGNGSGGQNNNGGNNNGGNGGHNNSGNGGNSGSGGSGLPSADKDGVSIPSNTSGMSRSATIAVATVVPIVTILLMAGLFFVYRWWRRRQNTITWDPKSECANLDRIRIIDEIAMPPATTATATASAMPSPSPQGVTPPSYYEHEFESTFNPTGKTPM